VLIRIDAGQELGEHQVKERAWICVVEGTVRVRAGGETMDATPGTLLHFEADERRSLASDDGARILMLLAPWPGVGHYRGEHQASTG
jgi:quercetin dioxygenase-like cupin family protein